MTKILICFKSVCDLLQSGSLEIDSTTFPYSKEVDNHQIQE